MKIRAHRYLGLGFWEEEEGEAEAVYAQGKVTCTEFTQVEVLCIDLE